MCIVSEFLQWLNDQLEKGKEKGVGEEMEDEILSPAFSHFQ